MPTFNKGTLDKYRRIVTKELEARNLKITGSIYAGGGAVFGGDLVVTGSISGSNFSGVIGTGDMTKAVYDTNDDGTVNDSDLLEGNTLTQVQNHAPITHSGSHYLGGGDQAYISQSQVVDRADFKVVTPQLDVTGSSISTVSGSINVTGSISGSAYYGPVMRVRTGSATTLFGRRINIQNSGSMIITMSRDAVNDEVVIGLQSTGSGGAGSGLADTVVEEVDFAQASTAGSADTVSRSDHTHGTPTLSQVDPQDVGSTLDSGSSNSGSRDDHVHRGVLSIADSGSADLYSRVYLTGSDGIVSSQSGQIIMFTTDPNAITSAHITGSTLVSGSEIAGATATITTVTATTLTGSFVQGDVSSTNIQGKNITGSVISGSNILGYSATVTTITGSTISGSFTGPLANITNVMATNVTGSTLSGSQVLGATIQGTTLTGSNVQGTSIEGQSATITYVNADSVTGSTISGSAILGETATITNIVADTITGSTISGSTVITSNFAPASITAQTVTGSSIVSGSELYGNTISGSQLGITGEISGSSYSGGVVTIRTGSEGSGYSQRRINFVTGSGMEIELTDDPSNEEITVELTANPSGIDFGSSVVEERTFGQASNAGISISVARADHTHGSPSVSNNNALDVGGTASSGSIGTGSRVDHIHRGVLSYAKSGSSDLYGRVYITGSANLNISQVLQTLTFSLPSSITLTNITGSNISGSNVKATNLTGSEASITTVHSDTMFTDDMVINNTLTIPAISTATVTGTSQVSGSSVIGQSAEFGTITGSTITGSNIQSANIMADYLHSIVITGSNILGTTMSVPYAILYKIWGTHYFGETVSGSDFISGSNVYGAFGKITNIVATTVTGSIVSGSTVYAGTFSVGTFNPTSVVAETITGSTVVSGSTVLGHNITGSNIVATYLTGSSISGSITQDIDANARVAVRENSSGVGYKRRRINLIEGTNITLSVNDDSTNEEVDVLISGVGGTGATYKPGYRYVIYKDGSDFYVYDNWDEAFELSLGTFAQLVSTFNTIAATDCTILWRNGLYYGSSATPFTIDGSKNVIVQGCGWNINGTKVQNVYPNGNTMLIDGAPAAEKNMIGLRDINLSTVYNGYNGGTVLKIDCPQSSRTPPLMLNNVMCSGKIGIDWVNPHHHSDIQNIYTYSSYDDDGIGLWLRHNDTATYRGDFPLRNIQLMNNVSVSNDGWTGLLIDVTPSGNTYSIEDITFDHMAILDYGNGTNDIGVELRANGAGGYAGITEITFNYATIENTNWIFYLNAGADWEHKITKIAVNGQWGRWGGNCSKVWYAKGCVSQCVVRDIWFYGGSTSVLVDENERTGLSDPIEEFNLFENCVFREGTSNTIEPYGYYTRFNNCRPQEFVDNLTSVVNGMGSCTGVPTTGNFQIGDLVHRTDGNLLYYKGSDGVLRQI